MSNMILFKPIAPSALAASRGTTAANLLTADPKEVWVDGAPGTATTIDVDFGSTQLIDAFLLGFTNAHDDAAWSITGGTSYTQETYLLGADLPAHSLLLERRHGFWLLPAPVTARYVRLTVTQPSGASTLQAGVLAIGEAFRPTFNREWGSGRQIIDMGSKEALIGGGFGISAGAIKSGYRWMFGDLTDTDLRYLYALVKSIGENAPVIIVEDPDNSNDLNERIHYGLFDRLEAYERSSPNRTRWGLSVQDWV